MKRTIIYVFGPKRLAARRKLTRW